MTHIDMVRSNRLIDGVVVASLTSSPKSLRAAVCAVHHQIFVKKSGG